MRSAAYAVRSVALALALGIGAATVGVGVASAETGTVKWFNTKKGFGFVTPDDGGPDLFVHFSAIITGSRQGVMSVQEFERVSYSVITGPKGNQAVKVQSLNPSGRRS